MKRCPNCNGSIIRMGHKEKPFFCNSCNKWFSNEEVTPKQTNADRIRMMTDEELAEFLDGEFWVLPNCKPDAPQDQETGMCLIASCHNCWLDWLKEEVNKQ